MYSSRGLHESLCILVIWRPLITVHSQEHLLEPSGQRSSTAKAWLKGSYNPSGSCKSLASTSSPSTSWSALSLNLKSKSYVSQKVSKDLQFSYSCSSACLTLGHLLKLMSLHVFISCMDNKSLLLSKRLHLQKIRGQ